MSPMPHDPIHPSALWPIPRKGALLDGFCHLPVRFDMDVSGGHPGLATAADMVAKSLSDWAMRGEPRSTKEQSGNRDAPFLLGRIDASAISGPQGYHLDIQPQQIRIIGSDEAGLFYGMGALRCWLRLHEGRPDLGYGSRIRRIRIEDRPDFLQRGAMLDISRDKIPTMESLFALVDQLAAWRINQLQLYTEHAFAYAGHEQVWRAADPMTPKQIRALDSFCRDRFISLAPNQNSFGHFHRWLMHPRYRPLAECPEGVAHPFSLEKEPFSLCPLDPGALRLLENLYAQLLPHFSADMFNVGLDETFDLGKGRSREACEQRGKSRVYLEFLNQVRELAARHGRRIQFWGDIVLEHPELIPSLPKDAIALEWGYEADHPFQQHGRQFSGSGLPFYVCPGTSSWFSIAGRAHNALHNLARAARHGKEAGAEGYLITDWGDFGHLQPAPVSLPGFIAGAGFAWNTASAEDPDRIDMAALLDRHALVEEGQGLGRTIMELGNAYLETGFLPANGSALFFLLRYPDQPLSHERLRGLTPDGLKRAESAIANGLSGMAASKGTRRADDPVERELRWAGSLLLWCCRFGQARLGLGGVRSPREIQGKARADLARDLRALALEHRDIWLLRNRRGGMTDSRAKLERVLAFLS